MKRNEILPGQPVHHPNSTTHPNVHVGHGKQNENTRNPYNSFDTTQLKRNAATGVGRFAHTILYTRFVHYHRALLYARKTIVNIIFRLFNCRVANDDGGGLVRYAAGVLPPDEAVVAPLSPPDGPRVLDGPVLDTVQYAVADDQYRMVDLHRIAVLQQNSKATTAAKR